MVYLIILFSLNILYTIHSLSIENNAPNEEAIYNKANAELTDAFSYIANLIFNGFENETADSIHEKVVAIENSMTTFQELQNGLDNTALENVLNAKVLKNEIIVEIAKLLEDLLVSINYIDSNETLPNDSNVKQFIRNNRYRLDHINDLNKQLPSYGVEQFPEITFEVLEYHVSILDLADSEYYINRLVFNGIVNDTDYEIHEKVASIEKNVKNLKWLRQKTMDNSFESQINESLPKYEMLLEVGKVMENFALFYKYVFWKMDEEATPFFMDKLTNFLNNMKNQLTTIYGRNEQFLKQETSLLPEAVIITIEERVNSSVVLFDYRNFMNIIFNSTIERLSSEEKEKIHETVIQLDRDFDALYVNDSLKGVNFAMVEYAKLVYEFAGFYDYFNVDENGEIPAEITPELMIKMKKIVDSLNEHVKHVKFGVPLPSNGEFMPLFAELYFEAVSLKHDPRRNPARALYLINEMDKNVEVIFGDAAASEQQQKLHELLKKAEEDTLSGQKDCYKSILLSLVQYKHYL